MLMVELEQQVVSQDHQLQELEEVVEFQVDQVELVVVEMVELIVVRQELVDLLTQVGEQVVELLTRMLVLVEKELSL
jgi:hypothetical protein